MQNTPHRQNLKTLQCGRALAALAVVLFHANLTLALPKYFGQEPAHLFAAGFSGIYYFFVLSGTVISFAHWSQLGRPQFTSIFFAKRLVRIYIPLWATLLLLIPLLWHRISPIDLFLAFSGLPADKETILAIEWTLRHELLFYTLFGLLLWSFRVGRIVFALWFAGSLISLAAIFPFPISFLFSPLHLLFGIGMLGTLLIRRCTPAPGLIAALGILIFSFAWAVQITNWPAPYFDPTLFYGIGSFFMIVGFAQMEISKGLNPPDILLLLGEASYSLYLVHFPVISVCAKLAHQIDGKYLRLPVGFCFIFVTLAAIAAGLVFHRYVEVPLVRLGRTALVKARPLDDTSSG
jgi:peptidoglycan/LPS O-acetylase OafA/YrhL